MRSKQRSKIKLIYACFIVLIGALIVTGSFFIEEVKREEKMDDAIQPL